jgi:phage-Barnase-EndoU-ColicinE5/D-RelE like nuclease3
MFEEIADLFAYIKQSEIEGTNKNRTLLLGVVSENTSLKIIEESGIDIEGYSISIDAYGIKHVLQGHGDKKRENSRGQQAVTEEDFGLLNQIINCPDNVFFDGTDKFGRDCFQFQVQKGHKYVIIMEVRTGKKLLTLKTMRIFTTKKENQNVNFNSL